MPLIDAYPDEAPLPVKNTVQITKPEFRGVTIDTEVIPETALLTHVQGSPYSVTYFTQVIGEDTGTSGVGGGISAVHQSYNRIYDMVLMVTSELSYGQDAETKDATYTGSAVVFPFLIPNEGDHFIGDLGYGRQGIFEVTTSRRLSLYKQTLHEIDFKLVRDATAVSIAELDQKTIKSVYYDKNFLDHGQNPLLVEEEYHLVGKLRRKYYSVVQNYIKMFFSREYSTILVGGQLDPTYDPKLVKFLLHLLSTSEAFEMSYIRALNTDSDPVIDSPSFWDALMRREDIVSHAYTHVGTTSAKYFSSNPSLESVRYSGVRLVVYPTNLLASVDLSHGFVPKPVETSLESTETSMFYTEGDFIPGRPLDIEFVLDNSPIPGFDSATQVHPSSKVLYHPIDPAGFYVLSGYFYRNGNNDAASQSQLETQLYNFINNRAIDIQVVNRLVEAIDDMKPLEQAYIVPLILLLIRQRIFITV